MTSIIPDDDPDKCYICGAWNPTDVHHMVFGRFRKMSDKYGLTVHLCRSCHRELHDHGTCRDLLIRIAQKELEKRYSHDLWMSEFGKNFL